MRAEEAALRGNCINCLNARRERNLINPGGGAKNRDGASRKRAR
jgi:hypothetical protein